VARGQRERGRHHQHQVGDAGGNHQADHLFAQDGGDQGQAHVAPVGPGGRKGAEGGIVPVVVVETAQDHGRQPEYQQARQPVAEEDGCVRDLAERAVGHEAEQQRGQGEVQHEAVERTDGRKRQAPAPCREVAAQHEREERDGDVEDRKHGRTERVGRGARGPLQGAARRSLYRTRAVG
jgi:hypothetical protein